MELVKEESRSWGLIAFLQHKILMLITNQIGGLPEFEKNNTENEVAAKTVKKSFIKRNKILKFSVFPLVLLLIIIDESYIRIKEFILNFTLSD
jgi:hypothetical protein